TLLTSSLLSMLSSLRRARAGSFVSIAADAAIDARRARRQDSMYAVNDAEIALLSAATCVCRAGREFASGNFSFHGGSHASRAGASGTQNSIFATWRQSPPAAFSISPTWRKMFAYCAG